MDARRDRLPFDLQRAGFERLSPDTYGSESVKKF